MQPYENLIHKALSDEADREFKAWLRAHEKRHTEFLRLRAIRIRALLNSKAVRS